MKLTKLLTLITFIIIGFVLLGQKKEKSKLSDFEITVEELDQGISLRCNKGCAWNKLEFSTPEGKISQEIDEFGMVQSEEELIPDNSGLASFRIKIEGAENILNLIGIEGTAWAELSFSVIPQKRQGINQFGMKEIP